MSFLSGILSVFKWFGKVFVDHAKSAAAVAVTITEAVKTVLDSAPAKFLEGVADAITHTNLATDAANVVTATIPKILAVELAIEGLPENPTEADIEAFEARVLTAFKVNPNNSKLYTTLAAQVYGIVQKTATNPTFANCVAAVEEAYQDYLADVAAQKQQATEEQNNIGEITGGGQE